MARIKITKDTVFNSIGLLILLAAFIMAIGRVSKRTMEELDPNLKIVRIAHWQLEPGVRQGVDAVIKRYMELNPDVRIIQMPVPEKAYDQYVSTQLVGGTAPDLIEMKPGVPQWDHYMARYFIPLSEEVFKVNQYNKGTPLEGKPWRETYKDGMQSAFNDKLMEYYGVPTTVHSVRLFYNKELLKKVRGVDTPPRTYAEYIQIANDVLDYARKHKETIVPIAGSKAHAQMMAWRLWNGVTGKEAEHCDIDLDGQCYKEESFLAFARNKWNFESPGLKAGMEVIKQVGDFCQPGFYQLNREDSHFYFMQQRAAFLAGGSWDDEGIRKNAQFEVGVCDYPIPDKNDPMYGHLATKRIAEIFWPHFQFGLVRTSKAPKAAIDFLKFFSSMEGSAIFVRESGWVPCIKGVEPLEHKKVFVPNIDGSGQQLRIHLYSNVNTILGKHQHLLYTDTKKFVENYAPLYFEAGVKDIVKDARRKLDGISDQQGRLDALREMAALKSADAKEKEKYQTKYRMSLQSGVEVEDLRALFLELTRNGVIERRLDVKELMP